MASVLTFGAWIHYRNYTLTQGVSALLVKAGYSLDLPELIELSAGTVNPTESAAVTVEQPFSIGKTEVTFAQYDTFVFATGHRLPVDYGWGRGDQPVIDVSWHDAVAYSRWLSDQIGQDCRLPSEAQWEYAARTGGEGEYGLSDGGVDITADNLGDYAWYWENAEHQAQEVGTRLPNAWGLYDMFGNVMEWTRDFYDKDRGTYALRGGAWLHYPAVLRAAERYAYPPGVRGNVFGFRVVCVPQK